MTRMPPKILMATGAIALIGAMSAQPALSRTPASALDIQVLELVNELEFSQTDIGFAIPVDGAVQMAEDVLDLRIREADEARDELAQTMNDPLSTQEQIDAGVAEHNSALLNVDAAHANIDVTDIDWPYRDALEALRNARRALLEMQFQLNDDESDGARGRRKNIRKALNATEPTFTIAMRVGGGWFGGRKTASNTARMAVSIATKSAVKGHVRRPVCNRY